MCEAAVLNISPYDAEQNAKRHVRDDARKHLTFSRDNTLVPHSGSHLYSEKRPKLQSVTFDYARFDLPA
jgi:hypothetical protein